MEQPAMDRLELAAVGVAVELVKEVRTQHHRPLELEEVDPVQHSNDKLIQRDQAKAQYE